METRTYTLKNGVISFNGVLKGINRNPPIMLFCFDAMLTKKQVLELFSLEDAKISLYAVCGITIEGKNEIPDYYTYEIN